MSMLAALLSMQPLKLLLAFLPILVPKHTYAAGFNGDLKTSNLSTPEEYFKALSAFLVSAQYDNAFEREINSKKNAASIIYGWGNIVSLPWLSKSRLGNILETPPSDVKLLLNDERLVDEFHRLKESDESKCATIVSAVFAAEDLRLQLLSADPDALSNQFKTFESILNVDMTVLGTKQSYLPNETLQWMSRRRKLYREKINSNSVAINVLEPICDMRNRDGLQTSVGTLAAAWNFSYPQRKYSSLQNLQCAHVLANLRPLDYDPAEMEDKFDDLKSVLEKLGDINTASKLKKVEELILAFQNTPNSYLTEDQVKEVIKLLSKHFWLPLRKDAVEFLVNPISHHARFSRIECIKNEIQFNNPYRWNVKAWHPFENAILKAALEAKENYSIGLKQPSSLIELKFSRAPDFADPNGSHFENRIKVLSSFGREAYYFAASGKKKTEKELLDDDSYLYMAANPLLPRFIQIEFLFLLKHADSDKFSRVISAWASKIDDEPDGIADIITWFVGTSYRAIISSLTRRWSDSVRNRMIKSSAPGNTTTPFQLVQHLKKINPEALPAIFANSLNLPINLTVADRIELLDALLAHPRLDLPDVFYDQLIFYPSNTATEVMTRVKCNASKAPTTNGLRAYIEWYTSNPKSDRSVTQKNLCYYYYSQLELKSALKAFNLCPKTRITIELVKELVEKKTMVDVLSLLTHYAHSGHFGDALQLLQSLTVAMTKDGETSEQKQRDLILSTALNSTHWESLQLLPYAVPGSQYVSLVLEFISRRQYERASIFICSQAASFTRDNRLTILRAIEKLKESGCFKLNSLDRNVFRVLMAYDDKSMLEFFEIVEVIAPKITDLHPTPQLILNNMIKTKKDSVTKAHQDLIVPMIRLFPKMTTLDVTLLSTADTYRLAAKNPKKRQILSDWIKKTALNSDTLICAEAAMNALLMTYAQKYQFAAFPFAELLEMLLAMDTLYEKEGLSTIEDKPPSFLPFSSLNIEHKRKTELKNRIHALKETLFKNLADVCKRARAAEGESKALADVFVNLFKAADDSSQLILFDALISNVKASDIAFEDRIRIMDALLDREKLRPDVLLTDAGASSFTEIALKLIAKCLPEIEDAKLDSPLIQSLLSRKSLWLPWDGPSAELKCRPDTQNCLVPALALLINASIERSREKPALLLIKDVEPASNEISKETPCEARLSSAACEKSEMQQEASSFVAPEVEFTNGEYQVTSDDENQESYPSVTNDEFTEEEYQIASSFEETDKKLLKESHRSQSTLAMVNVPFIDEAPSQPESSAYFSWTVTWWIIGMAILVVTIVFLIVKIIKTVDDISNPLPPQPSETV